VTARTSPQALDEDDSADECRDDQDRDHLSRHGEWGDVRRIVESKHENTS
jgi:hypothetical protein